MSQPQHDQNISASVTRVLEELDRQFDSSVRRLTQWLSIPSISTDPVYKDHCVKAANWLTEQFRMLGFTAELRRTPGHPIVFSHHPGPDGYHGPHILFYGHYDVQPADPVELWHSPPFEPTLADGPHGRQIIARGAVDDKGQVMMFVEALRAWKETTGEIPCRITCLIEGEEECGSVNMHDFLVQTRDELVGSKCHASPCDICVVSDTGMWDINTPAITYGLRGLCYLEVILRGPSRDLHSGLYGGCVPNPINELTRILGQLHDERNRVALPGFYDDVKPLSAQEKSEWDSLHFDEKTFLAEVGLKQGCGEQGYTMLERQWARPTCDINGIKGGYTGEGAKTVIPSHASAKVSFRLVPDQDPAKVVASFTKWFNKQLPTGCTAEVLDHGSGRPCMTPVDHPIMKLALTSLEEATGRKAVMIRSGGSIPVVEGFHSVLGLDTLMIGFGLNDDRVHSPNEKFEIKCYQMGQRSHAVLLGHIARSRSTQ